MLRPHRLVAPGALLLAVMSANAQETGAQETIDLLRQRRYESRLHVSASNPRVEPQVRVIRSNDEATLFSAAAWDEENEALHIDFAREQILVVAWGALRCDAQSLGWLTDIHLESAAITDGTLRVTVRTVLPPGPGIDIALDQPGRTSYPSLFVRTPRTERAEVDVIGARRRGPESDLRSLASKELTVRVAPDASPSRELVSIVAQDETRFTKVPKIGLYERDDRSILEVAWGKLGAGAYRLDLVGVSIDNGTARLTLRADNREIMIYSGSGEHNPSLAIALPRVDPPVSTVRLHIERVGIPLAAGERDFEAAVTDHLEVTVDRSGLRRQ